MSPSPATSTAVRDATVRILGIDPGSQITGFAIVDLDGTVARAVEWGGIRTSGDHCERLRAIFEGVAAVVAKFEPAEIAIERVFVHRNADSALKLGQARAAALCATFSAAVPVYEYAARHIKKAVAGAGAAQKEQVQRMVRMILGIRQEVEPDAADALAAAICHAHERRMRALVGRAASGL